MAELTPNLNLFKYDPITDVDVPFSIEQAMNDNWDILDDLATKLGGNRNIGEIVTSSLPLTDAGLHLLDGALILGDGIYSGFVNYISNLYNENPDANYFTDETTWQESISQYGVCGKFVYDEVNNTVRLPKVTGKMDGTTDINALGDLVPLFVKLPNITGTVNAIRSGNSWSHSYSGAFYDTGERNQCDQANGGSYPSAIGFDASRLSSVYSGNGSDTSIHEQAVKMFVYIVIATSTKTEIQVDIDQITTEINNMVSKSDLQEVQCVVETYVNGTSWYRIWSDGWCEQGGRINIASMQYGSTSVSLLKPFNDTNYTITIGGRNLTHNGNPCFSVGNSVTTNSFNIWMERSTGSDHANQSYWQACGYIEV